MDLHEKHCESCDGNAMPLDAISARPLLNALPDWELDPGEIQLCKQFQFPDFASALRFVNQIGALAEAEGHHPDLFLHFNLLDVMISTHVISGLTENDFILAAKISRLPR